MRKKYLVQGCCNKTRVCCYKMGRVKHYVWCFPLGDGGVVYKEPVVGDTPKHGVVTK